MNKLSYLLFLLIFCLSIFPVFIFSEEVDNSTETNNENQNNTNENEEEYYNDDPYKYIDFGNVITLDDSNATSEIKKYDLIYIMFYSNWCEFCGIFFPEFIGASKYSEENNLKVKFAKIDSSQSPNITEEFNVKGFPSVYLLNKTKKYNFEGQRTKEGLIKFIDRKLHDDVFEIQKLSEIEKFTNSSSTVILSTLRYFNTMLYQSFLNYSKTNQNVDFVMCLTEECLKEYGHNIVIYKQFDERINKYTKEIGPVSQAEPDSVKNFYGMYGIEAGGALNDTQINMMFEHKRNMLFYFRNSSNNEQTKYDKVIKELGIEFRNKKIYTVVSDIEGNPLYENIASTFVVVPEDLPTILLYELNNEGNDTNMVFIYSIRRAKKEQLTKEYIKDYIDKIKNKKIREDLFSQPPLDNYNVNGLKYIIGRTYDSDVIEEKNNVIITFIDTSVLCTECDIILDMMTNLTKKYTVKDNKVVFAYIDLSKNQPRDINVEEEGIPLILLYTNAMSDKKIIKLNHRNFTEIKIGEIEEFLYANLEWGKKSQNESNKEKVNQNEEIKAGKNSEKEDKKESDL